MSGGGGNQIPETPLQKAQAQVASQQWQDYQKRWLPVQQFFIQRTESNLPAKRAYLEGVGNTDVRGQFENAREGLNAALSQRGALPGSNASVFGNEKLASSKGQALGLNRTNVDDAVTRQYLGGLQDIVQMGRGQQATSDAALSDIAGMSGRSAAAQAQAAEQEAAGLGEAIGTGVGLGGGYGLSQYMDYLSRNPGGAKPAPVDYGYSDH